MPAITTTDGTEVFYKDWGSGQPIVFSHGWPLSADDWDAQLLFFLNHGYRVIAHDRRGHGRSAQTGDGHDMDHYADDLAALTAHLDLKDAIHVGHSTGGGEVAHYLGRHGESRVAKAALISAVPPLMVKTPANPRGLPKEVFDDLQAQLAANRAQFYRDVAAGPFYGYNRPGAKASEAVIQNWWRQGMMGGAKAHYDGIVAFSQTDFTEDLKKITVPVLVMHSEDDQIVPYIAAGPLSANLLKNATMKTYKGFPHGMPTTEADTINADLLAFKRAFLGRWHADRGMGSDEELPAAGPGAERNVGQGRWQGALCRAQPRARFPRREALECDPRVAHRSRGAALPQGGRPAGEVVLSRPSADGEPQRADRRCRADAGYGLGRAGGGGSNDRGGGAGRPGHPRGGQSL